MKARRAKREGVKKGGNGGPSESHSQFREPVALEPSGESWTVHSEQFQGGIGIPYVEPLEVPSELLKPIELPPELLQPIDLEGTLADLGEIRLEDLDVGSRGKLKLLERESRKSR